MQRTTFLAMMVAACAGCGGHGKAEEPKSVLEVPDKTMLLLSADCEHGDAEACEILAALGVSADACKGGDEQGCEVMMQILDAFTSVELALDSDPCLGQCVEECTLGCSEIADMQGTCSEHCLGKCDASCP